MRKVLLALQPGGQYALHAVKTFLKTNWNKNTDHLHFFYVYTPPTLHLGAGGMICPRSDHETYEQLKAENEYEDLVNELELTIEELRLKFEIPDSNFSFSYVDNSNHCEKAENIVCEILEEVRQKKIDLIVTGRRKVWDCPKKIFLGSISELLKMRAGRYSCRVEVYEKVVEEESGDDEAS